MEHLLNNLLGAVFGMYLPIADISARIAISIPSAGIVARILSTIFEWIGSNLNIINFFRRSYSYVIIGSEHDMYDKLTKHIYDRYTESLLGCKLEKDIGKNLFSIIKLKKHFVEETYLDKHKIFFNIREETKTNKTENDKSTSEEPKSKPDIMVSSNSSMMILESYLNSFIRDVNNKISNKIPIYRIRSHSSKKKDDRDFSWVCSIVKLSKNIKNTIVSETVEKNFYSDVEKFMLSENFYLEKGLPYKRGYILHGLPGCGKTSIIKAIANQYNLPIFIIDLSIIKSNTEFIKITSDINSHVSDDKKYIVVFEDIDKASMFDRWSEITMDCFLNILDGIDEYYGRITILTTNNLDKISSTKALVRPGRIDVIVELTTCTILQIESIIKCYVEDFDPNLMKINPDVIITPAQLIQLILILNDPNKIIAVLNKNKNFEKISHEKVLEIYHDNSKIDIDLLPVKQKQLDDGDDLDEPKSRLSKQIEQEKKKLSVVELKISQNEKKIDTMPVMDKLKYDRCVLSKKTIELRLEKLSERLELEQHNKKMNTDDPNEYKYKRKRRRCD